MKNNKNKNDNNSELYISYPFIKNDNFRLYQYEYVTYIEAFKEIIKNIKNSAIKRGYLRVYYIINKDKKINLNEIELFLFRYIFKIPLNVFYNTIITVKNINIEYKKNIKRTLKIRIICVFKSLLKDILFLTETKDLDYVNLKIIIKNGKIRTNGLYSIIGQSFLFLDPKYRFYIIYAVSKNGKMREHLAYRWKINNDYKKMSLTSVRKVSYVDIYNKWSSIKTNFIGYQENGKEQYILNYEYGNNFDKVYLESLKLDVSLLKEFGIMDQKSHIGFLMKIHIAVLAQEEWNILSRGTYSYQYKTTLNLSRSFIEEHIKLKEMSNDEAYEYLKMSLNTIEMQYLEKIYHENYTRYCYLHKNEIIDDIRKKITYNEQDFE